MPSKILSRSGASLADVYDVEGSIAGIEQLVSEDVNLVHEMGTVLNSERTTAVVRRQTTIALAQDLSWDLVLTDLVATTGRLLSVQVFVDTDRVAFCSVSVEQADLQREIPVFAWHTTFDDAVQTRMLDLGTVGAPLLLRPTGAPNGNLPTLLTGPSQRVPMSHIAFRGVMSSFGAGTATVFMIAHVAHHDVGAISSAGLPLPGC